MKRFTLGAGTNMMLRTIQNSCNHGSRHRIIGLAWYKKKYAFLDS